MSVNELIEQIGGRERLEAISKFHSGMIFPPSHNEIELMARALLAVLDAKPDFYIHRVEVCDTYGPEVELRAFNCQLDASKCRDDHGGEVIEAYTTPPAASAPTAMQPLYIAGDGRIRFKENAIVRHLLTSAGKVGVDLNSIAMDDFSDDDRMQLAQLIGYSLGGYGELSYVSDESYNAAVKAAPAPVGDGG